MSGPSWPNLAAFREWAAHIEALATATPDEPIPMSVVCIPAKPLSLTEGERAQARERVERWRTERGPTGEWTKEGG